VAGCRIACQCAQVETRRVGTVIKAAGVEVHDARFDMLPVLGLDLLRTLCREASHPDDLLSDGEGLVAFLEWFEQYGGTGYQQRAYQAQRDRHGDNLAGVIVGPGKHPQ